MLSSCTPSKEIVTEKEVVYEKVFERPQFPVERYERAEALMSWNLNGKLTHSNVQPSWISNAALWYSVNTRKGTEYFLVDIERNMKEPLFNQSDIAIALSEMLDDTTEVEPYSRVFQNMEVNSTLEFVTFEYDQKKWRVNRSDSSVEIVEELPDVERPDASVLSPDGTQAAFIKEHNLYVRNMKTGLDTQLTVDGEVGYGYATDSQGWSRSDRPILFWSDDSQRIATYRLDEREVEKMHLLKTATPRAELISWPYALPGDEHVPMHERIVINVKTGAITTLKTEPDHQRTSNCCGLTRGTQWADNQFSKDGRFLAYVSTSRDYKEVTLKIADTQSGDVQPVHFERDELFIETNLQSRGVPNWHVLFDSNEFIWFSRKSNWGHLYLYDLRSGELINQITQGNWNVADILEIDEINRRIYFTAVGMDKDRDPYQQYAYSIGFDGGGLRSHTPTEGNHAVSFSPEKNYLVSTRSDVRTPPVTLIKDVFGEVVMTLETADDIELIQTGWTKPESFTVKARDGKTDIYGLMYKPSDFDPTKKYPIINNIYPGPQVGSVGTRAFSPTRRGQVQALAELGFIVVQIDGLGTPMRSRDFHTYYYGDMSDNGLADQITAMEQLAEQHSFIDIERAAIYGHSGGGFATASALFNYPDFFKVGVAGAGNMDNRGYTFYWGEKFQGPMIQNEDETDSFTNQALQLQVDGLKGKLLISYGTLDSNVHPNMTLLVIDALISANKDFDLIVMPNRGHGYANESYKIRRTMDYFVEHLLGMSPPKEYEMSR